MSSLLTMLAGQLDDQAVKQISSQLGADDRSTQQAISTALPMLMGTLGRNTESPDGAQALSSALQRDHDGSIFNDVAGALSNPSTMQDGQAILGHVLGGKQNNVQMGVAKASGLDMGSTGQLLTMLAPLVLGALGQTQQQQGLDAGALAGLLQTERQESDSALSGMAQLLDMDGDGDITDDVINIGSKLLGSFFGSR